MMFYTAMIDSGVDPSYAKLLYYGVRVGGPKWKQVLISHYGVVARKPTTRLQVLPTQKLSKNQVDAFRKELDQRNAEGNPISLDEIDQRTPLTK